ncbi:hypothetical protein [Archangium violaceum]|uniref:Uncharacterized protein n=1 Tax=Archangium violaceum Cb vi76 TaxID=1406225 RepID=A0A084SSY2_9BACT|nr:hypothetical protein [Archangium violaceum]KFA91567.1 hypothetical protein Q664_21315 [Archangium violaceum Cb vi76]
MLGPLPSSNTTPRLNVLPQLLGMPQYSPAHRQRLHQKRQHRRQRVSLSPASPRVQPWATISRFEEGKLAEYNAYVDSSELFNPRRA